MTPRCSARTSAAVEDARARRRGESRAEPCPRGDDESRDTPSVRGRAAPWPDSPPPPSSTWLARHGPGAAPLPAALAACLAGVLVAAVPRAGWLILAAAAAAWLIVDVTPRRGARAPRRGAVVPVLAGARATGRPGRSPPPRPALGTLGLAAAWPALAGLTRNSPPPRGPRRHRLPLDRARQQSGIAPTTSLPDAVHHVLGPARHAGHARHRRRSGPRPRSPCRSPAAGAGRRSNACASACGRSPSRWPRSPPSTRPGRYTSRPSSWAPARARSWRLSPGGQAAGLTRRQIGERSRRRPRSMKRVLRRDVAAEP